MPLEAAAPAVGAATDQAWSMVDLALGLGLGLSTLVGLWRGLIKEVLSLLGWGVAYFAAQWWGPQAAVWVPVGSLGSRLNLLAGMMVVFVLAWLCWALVMWAVRELVSATGLGGTDRLLGAAFGLMRGLLVALVAYTLLSMTPITHWAPWQASKALPWLAVVLQGLRPVLPAEVIRHLPPDHAS
jgi:membrane protein required for colicin V production